MLLLSEPLEFPLISGRRGNITARCAVRAACFFSTMATPCDSVSEDTILDYTALELESILQEVEKIESALDNESDVDVGGGSESESGCHHKM